MKKVLIIGGVFLVIALVIVVLFQKAHHVTKLTTSSIVAHNIQYPYQKDANTLYYFTGSSFASYNLQANTTKSLTPYYFLPLSISSVRWSPNGAIFKASSYSSVDQLDKQITSRGLPDSQPVWWLCDFKTGAITPLLSPGSNTIATDAVWQNNGSAVVYIASKPPTGINGEYIPSVYRYDIQKQTNSPVATIPAPLNVPLQLLWSDGYAADFSATNQNHTKADTLKLTFASGTVDTLIDNAYTSSTISKDGQWLVYVKPTNPGSEGNSSGDLMTLNLASKQQYKVVSKYSGIFNISADNIVSYSPTQPSSPATPTSTTSVTVNTLDLASNQTNRYDVPNTAFSPSNQLAAIIPTGDASQPLILSSLYGDLTILSVGKSSSAVKINTQYLLSDPVQQTDYMTSYDQDQQVFTVYIKKTPLVNTESEVLAYIKKAGVDPNQVNIKWYPPDGYSF
jgi:hypothetical protein